MTRVRAHLRLGRPVREHARRLGPLSRGLLGFYRSERKRLFPGLYSKAGARRMARGLTQAKIADAAALKPRPAKVRRSWLTSQDAYQRLGRRLYRIETGGSLGMQASLFSRLNTLAASSPEHRAEAVRLLGGSPKHWFTHAGWKRFGREAYVGMRAAGLRPRLRHRRGKGAYRIVRQRGSDPFQVLA